MKSIYLALLVLFSLTSCSQHNTIKGDVSTKDNILLEYVVYFIQDDAISAESAKNLVKSKLSNIKLLDSFTDPRNLRGVNLLISGITDVKNEFPPMDMETLNYTSKGLNEEDKINLQEAKRALILDFICPKEEQLETLKLANTLLKHISKDKNVIFFDTETRETFGKDFWFQHRTITGNSVDISKHITIHFYQKDEFCRAITLGMSKFGLPDVCIQDLSCNSDNALASFLNLIGQTLLENPIINDDGSLHLKIENIKNTSLRTRLLESVYENAQKEAKITFIEGFLEEGDPENTLLEVEFKGDNPQIEHNDILTTLFGSVDEITMEKHDEKLLNASNEAKQRIPELQTMFNKGLGVNSTLLMKFPFEYSEGNEWMWVEITNWEGDMVNGILQSEPSFIKNLKAGQKVKKNVDEMFDYILYKPDGAQEGNETGKIMMERM